VIKKEKEKNLAIYILLIRKDEVLCLRTCEGSEPRSSG